MQTTITARHCEITEALRERAGTVAERLGALAHPPDRVRRRVRHRRRQPPAELRLHTARGEMLVARRSGRSSDGARPRRGEAPAAAREGLAAGRARRARARCPRG